MLTNYRNKIFLLISLLCSLFCSVSYARTNTLHQKSIELKSLSQKISLLKNNIAVFRTKKQNVATQLKATTAAMHTLNRRIIITQTNIHKQQISLNNAKQQQDNETAKLTLQKQQLTELIHFTYMLSRQSYLKIILNNEKPETVTRYLKYCQAINQERLSLIKQIQSTLQDIANTEHLIQQRTEKLQATYQTQHQQQLALNHARIKRQVLLHHIVSTLHNKNTQLKQLNRDKQHLEHIIKTLNQRAQYGYFPGQKFYQRKGRLFWPFKHGYILQRFHQRIAQGHLRSTGILIGGKPGTPIHAIFPGKVIFANKLRGFGLLTIIQHGKSYMTLYAHNQKLYVKTGMNIKAGQTIATLGNSGDTTHNAVYFEIRHKGIPLDPLRWLKK